MPPTNQKRLFLIDGMSHIYRAYYAIRGLSNSRGIPTNATYGFTMMLRKLLTTEKPEYLAVVFDSRERTFRHDAYEHYKATRTLMPDDLQLQIPYIERICAALRIPTVRQSGFEADDVIGTLAVQAEQLGFEVVIVTNDKDMCQLVTDQVKILRTAPNGAMTVLDSQGVEGKLGVRPDQVVDLLGLWGDTSDNIPGAPGVGEKGAQQIIKQFGTLDAALERAGEIARKGYRESLQNNINLILQSRDLARIRCDVPVDLDPNTLEVQAPDSRAAYEVFSELEFTQLTRDFADAAQAGAPAPVSTAEKTAYSLVTNRRELETLAGSIWEADQLSLAVCQREGSLAGIAICTEPGAAALIDFEAFKGEDDPLPIIKEVLENGLVRKVVHDWKSILCALDRHACLAEASVAAGKGGGRSENSGRLPDFRPALRIEGVNDDTMLSAYLLDPNRSNYRLRDIGREFLHIEIPENIPGFDTEQRQALEAADLTLRLADVLRGKLEEAGLENLYREIELPLVEILFDMEQTGVLIDTAALEKAGTEMEEELSRLTGRIYDLAGEEFNINSTVQLGDIFEKLNFEVARKTKTGRISTSFDVLEELASRYELPRLIIEYREIAKLKSTYVDALPKLINPRTGRVHTTLNQAVSATGRLSSTNPNLQNIPIRSEMGRRIRAAFVSSPGHVMMSADYSQIELRIFAHITGDPVMTEAFKRGEDIHAQTARVVFGAKTKQEESEVRRLAKIVNFAIPYVIGPFGLAQRTGLSRAEAKKVISDYYQTYTGVRRYMEETPGQVRESGVVRTIFGRIRPIPDINNRNRNLRARAEREAINAPIQGTAADLVKMAMLQVHDRLKREKLGGRMILQVHDELLLEVPEVEAGRTAEAVRQEMEGVYKLTVPLVVDVGYGRNWMKAKP